MPTFKNRKEFIEKRVKELSKFNILKQKVSGPFPQRLKSNSKDHYEIYKKYSKARKYTQKSILNQIERNKIDKGMCQTQANYFPLSPQMKKLPKLNTEGKDS